MKRRYVSTKRGGYAKRHHHHTINTGRVKDTRTPSISSWYRMASVSAPELKFLDVAVDLDPLNTSGTIINSGTLNVIVQGTGDSQRIGRKVTIRKISWRGFITLDGQSTTGAQSASVARLILYQDRQCNGSAAAVTDILQSATGMSFNKLSNAGRFHVIMDTMYDLIPTSGAGNGTANDFSSTVISFDFHKDCSIPLEYSGSAGTITTIRSNNLGILIIKAGGSSPTEISSIVRLRYSDD